MSESHSSQSIELPLSFAPAMPVEQDDAALVAASKGGDQNAFALLVQRHQHRVFNLVYRILQHYDEANEVTQETFLAAWQGIPAFRGEAQFSTWVYRIAYNCSQKQLEQRRRDRVLQSAVQEEQETQAAQMAQESETDRVDAALDARERQVFVREQLSTLPAKYRIVLVLRHLQEKTYEEMADILAMPVGTIKTHLFRARNLLKQRLQSKEHEEM
jgi:RNA polymerase sigma-70 factor (ECF subfamily)